MNNLIICQLKSQIKLKNLALKITFFCIIALFLLNSPNLLQNFSASKKLHLGLANEDSNPMIGVLINSFENNTAFNAQFKIDIADSNTIKDDFKQGKLDCYIIIPEGFTHSLLGYDQSALPIYTKDGFPTQRLLLKNIFASYAEYVKLTNAATITLYQHLAAAGFDQQALTDSNNKFSVEMIQTAMARQSHFQMKAYDEMASANASDYYLISLSILMLSLSAIASSTKALKFIDSKIGARAFITGISSEKYLLATHIVSLLNNAIIILFLLILSTFFDINSARLLLTLIIASLFWNSIFLTLSLYSDNAQSAITIAIPIAIVLAVIGGALTPIAMLSYNLKQIASFSPHFAFTAFCLNLPTLQWQLLFLYIATAIALLPLQTKLLKKRIGSGRC